MNQIDIEFSGGIVLRYDLLDTPVVVRWTELLDSMPRSLAPRSQTYNHLHGFANQIEIDNAVERFQALSSKYQFNIPAINSTNWHTVLNRAHILFPNWRPTNDEQLFDSHEFNVIIHWLEYELANAYDGRGEYLINVDFNQDPSTRAVMPPFDPDDFQHFSPILEFGNIHLHYVHKGRHFLELANALDFDAPQDHFVPQHRYNATFGMVFSEPGARDYGALQQYYVDRGGVDFFHKIYDDPTLASGFYKLGCLTNVDDYRSNKDRRNDLRQQLAGSSVVDWRIQ